MAVAFGTSGLRGLVVSLSDDVIQSYVRAFLASCSFGRGLFVGRDLRHSSPQISRSVIAAARSAGVDVTDLGMLPTPALALAAMRAGASAVMVTGSHIPDDRNGLKFYTPSGEISKSDEARIIASMDAPSRNGALGALRNGTDAAYTQRYVDAFGPQALAGLRLGIYQHSSAARDILVDLVQRLGGQALPFARANHFIPIDTEALSPDTRGMLAGWAAQHGLDAILSTDGDGDRPMLADSHGRVIAGDILGVLTAQAIGADNVCTPVSSHSMIEGIASFQSVIRCKIGSPYVIAAIECVLEQDPLARVVGFEANGGFLLGFAAQGPNGQLPPLMTRDAVLPLLAPLAHARAQGHSLADALAALPQRSAASDRLTEIAASDGAAFLAALQDASARAAFLAPFGQETALNRVDGLRMTLADGHILHLRPSGNAPEFRIYVEAADAGAAQDMLRAAMIHTARALKNAETPS
jgi:phosphomannomutase